jgi:hypothetical protein
MRHNQASETDQKSEWAYKPELKNDLDLAWKLNDRPRENRDFADNQLRAPSAVIHQCGEIT